MKIIDHTFEAKVPHHNGGETVITIAYAANREVITLKKEHLSGGDYEVARLHFSFDELRDIFNLCDQVSKAHEVLLEALS